MKKLTFRPIDETLEVRTDSPLLQALLAKKMNVLMACGGNGLCATCHVHVEGGMEQLSPRTERERRTLSFITGTTATSRLACQSRVRGNGVEVRVPQGMYIERAEDLLGLLGTRAPADVLHPIKGTVLVARGKIITRSVIEALRGLNVEVGQVRPPERVPSVPEPKPMPRPPVQLPFGTPRPESIAEEEVKPPTSVHGLTTRPRTGGARPTAIMPADATAQGYDVGSTLGKCLLIERIGQGGSGVVFRALHRSLNIAVAVKVLQIEASTADHDLYHKLRGEAQLLAQLNHPNIVRVWDFEEDARFPYLVLEHVEGLSLAELIDQSGRLTPDRAVSIVLQMTEALAVAWKVGIVHRDVKPGNILLSKDGMAKLADLGLALIVDPAQRPTAGDPCESMEGTVAYMSPEQATAAARVDHRADIYSLGATLYHAVTGRLPFRGRSRMEVMLKHQREQPTPPHQLVPELPLTVSAIVARMMAKKPEQRYQTYEELREELEQLQDQIAGTASPLSACYGPAHATAQLGSTSSGEAARPLWKLLLSSFGRKRADRAP